MYTCNPTMVYTVSSRPIPHTGALRAGVMCPASLILRTANAGNKVSLPAYRGLLHPFNLASNVMLQGWDGGVSLLHAPD